MVLFGPPNISKLQAKQDIPALIKALDYTKDASVRCDAAKALGQLRSDDAVKPLVQRATDADAEMRAAVLWALGAIGTPETHNTLLHAIHDTSPAVQAVVFDALHTLPEAIAPLLAYLQQHPNSEQVTLLLETLTRIGTHLDQTTRNEQLVEPLGTMVPNVLPAQRSAILAALTNMGWKPDNSTIAAWYYVEKHAWEQCVPMGATAAQPLITMLHHEDKTVRQAAFQALVQIGNAAVPALTNTFAHEEPEMQQAAYWVVAKIGAAAIPTLVDALKDERDIVRQLAAQVCGQIGNTQAVVPLIGAFQDKDWNVRRNAYKAIVSIGKPALAELLAALKHPNEEIRWGAAGTLEAIGWKPGNDDIAARYWIVKGEWHKCADIGEVSIPPLLESLTHWDNDVCKEAMGTLVRIGIPAVVPLIGMLTHEKPAVRMCAATALGYIGDERAEKPLMELLSERDKDVSKAASDAISAIQTGEVWRG